MKRGLSPLPSAGRGESPSSRWNLSPRPQNHHPQRLAQDEPDLPRLRLRAEILADRLAIRTRRELASGVAGGDPGEEGVEIREGLDPVDDRVPLDRHHAVGHAGCERRRRLGADRGLVLDAAHRPKKLPSASGSTTTMPRPGR